MQRITDLISGHATSGHRLVSGRLSATPSAVQGKTKPVARGKTKRWSRWLGLTFALPILAASSPLFAQEATADDAEAAETSASDPSTTDPSTTEPAAEPPAQDAASEESDKEKEDAKPMLDSEAASTDCTSDNDETGGTDCARRGGDDIEPAKGDGLFNDSGPEIPVSEYVPEAERMLNEMRNELSQALNTLARARQEKDAVKLNYVNEQVTNMKGIMRISEDAFISLQEAVSTNALEKARYEFGKIRVSHRKMKELSAAVQNAKGAEASYTGGTDVTLEINQAIVGGDPYYGNPDFFNTPNTGVVDNGDEGVGSEEVADARPQPASGV